MAVGVGGRAIRIGTDAPEVIAALAPWKIADIGDPTDYCVELHPGAGDGRVRRLPGLYHGTTALFRSQDTARLATALNRVLGSYAHPAGDGQFRIRLMPVVRDGVAFLIPPATAAAVPDRWLASEGIEAFHTVSSLVDAAGGRVLLDPPLGRNENSVALAFGGWWLPHKEWEGELSAGFAVAELMALTLDVTAANAASIMRAVALLAERTRPAFAPVTVKALRSALIDVLDRAGAP